MAIETSRWIATVHQQQAGAHRDPPMTACATVDAGISQA